MTGKDENINYKPMVVLSAMFMGIIGSGFVSKENASVQNVPSLTQQKMEVKHLVENAVSIQAGNINAVQTIISTVLKDKIPAMSTPVLISQENLISIYQVADYVVKLEFFDINSTREQEILVSVQKAQNASNSKHETMLLTAVKEELAIGELENDLIATYKLKVNVYDDVKPIIKLCQEEETLEEGDSFDADQYIEEITDNVDKNLDYSVESDVDTEQAGTYQVTYRTKDSSGNESSATLTVHVKEKEKEIVMEETMPVAKGNVQSFSKAGSVLNAAMAQLGIGQDCTSLVSNALASQGIYFHGYPSQYLSLGSVISADQAQPGDILYYANGGTGSAHIAIYAGNGQAVHGGWKGNQTVIDSAYVGSGPVFIRVNK